MAGNTGDKEGSGAAKPGKIHRITSKELEAVLARAQAEEWTDLVVFGPRAWTPSAAIEWPDDLSGREIFKVTDYPAALVTHLRSLFHLRSLALRSLGLDASAIRSLATTLTQLSSLDLQSNQIGDEGAKAIAQNLTQLSSLGLWSNQIGDEGAKAIARCLRQLSTLHLGGNRIGDKGAKAIAQNLTQLSSLNLQRAQIGDEGAKAIAQNLTQLSSLGLWSNQIGDEGAKAIAQNLKQLRSLELSSNQVGDEGAKAIAQNLTQLLYLNLGFNQIRDEGAKAIAQNLKHLSSLTLCFNPVGNEGAKAIAQNLKQLSSLDLSSTKIGDEGVAAIAEGLGLLESLALQDNPKIRSVAWSKTPPLLRHLDLSKTGVADLSPLKGLISNGIRLWWGTGFSSDDGISVRHCPLIHPTLEIVNQGHEAILNYFREIERQGRDYLFEAKVLLVGEGGEGKTSLLRRLYYPGQDLPNEEQSTRGIEIHVEHFQRKDGGPFRLNVWDFGGQQIYHATHQFFLTKSSLYVLVDDTRKDHTSVHDEGFKYWLEVVEAFGDKSPVLIFQNEKGGRSKKIDQAGIKGRFPNVLQTLQGDLSLPQSADDLRAAIEQVVQTLPHVGEAVPAKWVSVRAEIEKVAQEKPHISLDEYLALYDKHLEHLEHDHTKAMHLSRYLHDIGVFLHFQDDLRLHKTVIVQNRWATEAVFRILDDEQVKGRLGYFDRSDCNRLWKDSEYAAMHGELLALMEKFELCYPLPGAEQWLAPQLLCPSTPDYAQGWAQPSDLVLTYRYDFLPRGLVSRLMVRMHRFVPDPGKCWANGARFERQGTEVLAITENTGNAITLRARGPEKKALLSVIASALDDLNAGFRGLEGKIHKWVPCVCKECSAATAPELFDEEYLRKRRRDGKLSIECRKTYDEVNVMELLDGIKLEQLPTWANPPKAERTIKIFLASSAELREDRDAFELHFRQETDRLRKRGVYLEIVRWENFLDAMSETRLQDEYNRHIRACDIFVALFMTKTGKFTEEEFNVAHQSFKATKKPLIYTFFKQAQIPTTEEGHASLTKLINFKRRLKDLGHFWTEYANTEHLLLLFGRQLDKLEANDFQGHQPLE